MRVMNASLPGDVESRFSGAVGLPRATSWGLDQVVAELRRSRELVHRIRHVDDVRQLPSHDAMVAVIDGLKAVMFPTHYGKIDLDDESIDHYVGNTLDATLRILADQIARALRYSGAEDWRDASAMQRHTVHLARTLAQQLPAIRALLVSDIHAALAGDPAAHHVTEVLLCYPGLDAILHHRLAHALHGLGVPLLARLIASIAHARTSIDIHPAATLGKSFFIDHGTGVVIGETAIVGDHVRLYQGVTLGAKRLPLAADGTVKKGTARHPIIEDYVVIYAGATILGRVTIGRESTIGGNVWLTTSVAPGQVVLQHETADARARNYRAAASANALAQGSETDAP